MGKGIRQNRFVTLGKELALKSGRVGAGLRGVVVAVLVWDARECVLGPGAAARSDRPCLLLALEHSLQNWYELGESDCLIKTSIVMVRKDVDTM